MDSNASTEGLRLPHGLGFEDLYDREGLAKIDGLFLEHLRSADAGLHGRLLAARARPDALDGKEESDLLVEIGPHLEDFLGDLFGIGAELRALAARHDALAPIYACKRLFVQRRAAKSIKADEAEGFDGAALAAELTDRFGEPFGELAFARHVMAWLDDEDAHADDLEIARRYAAWAVHSVAGRARHRHDVLFKTPERIDPYHLIPVETEAVDGFDALRLPADQLRRRDGFELTDQRMDLNAALDQAHYCIFCHNQDKDSCSKGLREKGSGEFRKSPFNVTLAGCPLEEKISEMNLLKSRGCTLGALAVVVVDNPMVAGTGHRICNDCMKSCIYQKQEPVDIPQVETRVLKDTLDLPWGFELYSLLTRWNPLDVRRPLPKAPTGYKVLIVGLGPAGFTLAHHLINEGHTVVAVDGLKIEPLPGEICGVTPHGRRVPFRPIRDMKDLHESLDDRVMAGFGGVAEYGITVRWDKNFLKVIRLLLERRRKFAMYGGVRFGGTMTVDSAFETGFDHIALCAGAGRPSHIPIPNALARGVREASDFLMALQLTGAAKRQSVANLQLRMPVVVVGGGLTAIDTATEALAYYPVQVEKFLERYETLVSERGEKAVRANWTVEDATIADEFIAHARAIRAEREAAAREGRPPHLLELLEGWGGVTIAYRRRLVDAPSYTLNHEEVNKALEEGIRFAEGLSPVAVEVDGFLHAKALRLAHMNVDETGKMTPTGAETVLPARSVLIAAGTHPNTVLAREDPHSVTMHGKYFRAVNDAGEPVSPSYVAKPDEVYVLASTREDGRALSFFGDLHPSYAGNVVKAMGSAKQGYPVVCRILEKRPPSQPSPEALIRRLDSDLRATVQEVVRLTPAIVEVIVRAPVAARRFRPGQFYRLQNFETCARRADGTILAMEGLAMTGAWVDREKGLVSVIVLEMGGSSDLCSLLKPGEPVILMGPTGTPTEIPEGETVLLAGGGLGNAVLFSIGQAMRAAGCRVVYFAGYKKMSDRYKVDQIEAAADVVVWCSDEPPGFEPSRPQDKAFVGNIVEAIAAYGRGEIGETDIRLQDVDRIMAIGSDRMMAAVAQARHTVLKGMLKPDHRAISSINSPMQCMMKEICAQCLQPHRDPMTGEETVVFSCFNQDQPMDLVDFSALHERLGQNALQEKLTAQWIDRCLRYLEVRRMAS